MVKRSDIILIPSRTVYTPVSSESGLTKAILIVLAVGLLALIVVLPAATIFIEAFRRGVGAYWAALTDPDTLEAIWLTLRIAAAAVAFNIVVGCAAAWAVAKFEFPGKSALLTFIDLPFSVSPVVAGLTFILLFGSHGYFGPWLAAHNIQIIFAVPGILLATLFVTFPFIARELIPLMQAQGTQEEEAALSLGASGWRTFFMVTLPNIKWGLLYGVLLCNARAMGEFGAVAVVSGHIRGLTDTMPLQVEILYNEYNFVAAFAVASLLALLALVTLALKSLLEWRYADELAAGA
ncbi:MAG: sulfate ABC transporter permease subunit CysW [Xanthobacteraceae bacterium]|nr:sulfate ABC transporter permease subunit CysW [Xanthobacteraceae bacterium]